MYNFIFGVFRSVYSENSESLTDPTMIRMSEDEANSQGLRLHAFDLRRAVVVKPTFRIRIIIDRRGCRFRELVEANAG